MDQTALRRRAIRRIMLIVVCGLAAGGLVRVRIGIQLFPPIAGVSLAIAIGIAVGVVVGRAIRRLKRDLPHA